MTHIEIRHTYGKPDVAGNGGIAIFGTRPDNDPAPALFGPDTCVIDWAVAQRVATTSRGRQFCLGMYTGCESQESIYATFRIHFVMPIANASSWYAKLENF